MKTTALRHMQVLFDTLGRMSRTPMPTLMTVLIVGIAISLPLVLQKIADGLTSVSSQWQGNYQMTLFLNQPDNMNHAQLDDWATEMGFNLLQIPSIKDVEYVSSEQALTEFRELSGYGDLMENLAENPLPPLLIVFPESDLSANELDQLMEQLTAMSEIDSVSFDQQWLERLTAIVGLFHRGVLVLAVLMGLGVILIISNTVRLGILSRSEEIEIIDQIGGTAAFIRRPFLYFGLIQGIAGSFAALLIANASLYILSAPVNRLAELYHSKLRIGWVGFTTSGEVILLAGLLGWLAARVTIDNYIRKLRASVRER